MIEIPPGSKLVMENIDGKLNMSEMEGEIVISYNDFYKLQDGTYVIVERAWEDKWDSAKA